MTHGCDRCKERRSADNHKWSYLEIKDGIYRVCEECAVVILKCISEYMKGKL